MNTTNSKLIEDRDVDEFYRGTLFSLDGKLFQFAYADRCGDHAPYRLFLRCRKGWFIFDEASHESFGHKLQRELKNPLLCNNSVEYCYNKRLGVLLTNYGHWVSRDLSKRVCETQLDAIPRKQQAAPELVMRRLLSAIRKTYRGAMRNLAVSEDESRDYSQYIREAHRPLLSHITIIVNDSPNGIMAYPSHYQKIGPLLSVGGGPVHKNHQKTNEILNRLEIPPEKWDIFERCVTESDLLDDEQILSKISRKGMSPGQLGYWVSYMTDTDGGVTHLGSLNLDQSAAKISVQ